MKIAWAIIFFTAVQLLYDEEKQHWIATSYQSGSEVSVFNSYFTGRLSSSVELQLCQIYSPLIDSEGLLVSIVPMQQQTSGTLHCGPFSIAATYHTAVGDDVGSLTFDEGKMRQHLAQCFEQEKLCRFPLASARCKVSRAPQQYLLVEVNCSCKRPDSFENMVACDSCDQWFHLSCVNLKCPPEDDWFCGSCLWLLI